jgi:hypothetical protein
LLILDSHGSYVTPEFDQNCLDHSIIVLCTPPHSSHLLQPLDVGCFSALKRSYGRLVEQKMGAGVNHIDKQEFLPLYQRARFEALSKQNIQSGFAATGLILYNPDRVLSLIHAQFKTLSPQLLPLAPPPAEVTETPHNIAQLQQQTNLLKQYLKRRTQSPLSPTEQALDQLVKGYKIAMHSAVLLVSENKKLLAENHRQKAKRAKKRSYIQRGGVLKGTEVLSLIEEENRVTKRVETSSNRGRQKAPPRCSLCGSLDYKAPRCPVNQQY